MNAATIGYADGTWVLRHGTANLGRRKVIAHVHDGNVISLDPRIHLDAFPNEILGAIAAGVDHTVDGHPLLRMPRPVVEVLEDAVHVAYAITHGDTDAIADAEHALSFCNVVLAERYLAEAAFIYAAFAGRQVLPCADGTLAQRRTVGPVLIAEIRKIRHRISSSALFRLGCNSSFVAPFELLAEDATKVWDGLRRDGKVDELSEFTRRAAEWIDANRTAFDKTELHLNTDELAVILEPRDHEGNVANPDTHARVARLLCLVTDEDLADDETGARSDDIARLLLLLDFNHVGRIIDGGYTGYRAAESVRALAETVYF